MRRLLWGLALLLALPVAAQTLTVTAASPTDFSAGVPLATEIRFTFSAPLAPLDAAPAPALIVLPDSAITLGEPSLSPDGRTLTYPATLRAATRYVALLPTAVSATGDRLARAAALNWTTSAQAGSFSVSGTVSDPSGAAVDGALVALVTADLATGAVQLVALRVLSSAASSQAYSLGPVPIGLYFAAAVRLPGILVDPTSTVPPALGFYDSNADGTPDPILLPFNINVALGPLPTATAAEYADAAATAADGAVPGSVLTAIPAQAVADDGGAPFWSYRYEGAEAAVTIVQLGPVSLPVPDAAPTGATALPLPFVDTDAAVGAADAAGGAAFRAQHPGAVVTVGSAQAAVPVWRVDYADASGARLTVDIDFVTGAVVETTAAADRPAAGSPTLALAGANPARGTVRLVATLPTSAAARVTVVDARGRIVAVLADGRLPAGDTPLAWAADAPAGAYWLVFDAHGRRVVLPVTLVH